ncbi:MAG: exodeoxyribonuclease VII large subunit [Panacagrimonas sp.]
MNDASPRTVHSVSELAEMLRTLIEDSLPRLWVEGEISNFSRPASGHWYFTLKDERAQLRCAMFRGQNFHVRPQPRDGDRVRVRAQTSFYTARGDLQLICEHLEAAGEGALLRAFEALKRRLAAEGLFDPALKRPIPKSVRRLGIITSATGAAVQDVTAALARRFPMMSVLLWPVPVQGVAAAPAIVAALRGLPARVAVDVILLVRGGGSLEDLWAFNEESVARAIRACTVPVVTGIGHEIDTSIADFAADLRAPTPTAAAELVSPDQAVFLARLTQIESISARALGRSLRAAHEHHERVAGRLLPLHPRRALRIRAQRLDELDERLRATTSRLAVERSLRLHALTARLGTRHPESRIQRLHEQRTSLESRLGTSLRQRLKRLVDQMQASRSLLDSLNPQAVLERGYAVARSTQGEVLRDTKQLADGEPFTLTLARGSLLAHRDSDSDRGHPAGPGT